MFERTYFTPNSNWNVGREEFVEFAYRLSDGADACPSIVFHNTEDTEFHHVLSLNEARFLRNKLDAYLEQVIGAQRDLWIQEIVDGVQEDIKWLLKTRRDAEVNWQDNDASLHVGYSENTIGLQVNGVTASWDTDEWPTVDILEQAAQFVRYALGLK